MKFMDGIEEKKLTKYRLKLVSMQIIEQGDTVDTKEDKFQRS